MRHNLLVVDDEPSITKALKSFFEEKGFRVNTAQTAEEAISQAKKSALEVVLLDLRLPDGSGLDVLTELKRQDPSIRVVVISGYADQATITEARKRGADEVLHKPFDFTHCFYAAMGIEIVDVNEMAAKKTAIAKVPVAVARQYQVLPINMDQEGVTLATADPLDVQRLDELRMLLNCEVRFCAAVAGDLDAAINRCYGVGADIAAKVSNASLRYAAVVSEPAQEDQADERGIVRLVNDLIQRARANRATDLHLGISSQGPWIRERVDGVLYDVPVADQFAQFYPSVISRLKVMARMDIAEHRVPQDGRIDFALGKDRVDLRVSAMPSLHGENLAIRILESTATLKLSQLGMQADQLSDVKAILNKPTGLFLVTGPTGSGKTTSLYAFLSMLSMRKVNILTIEDPVEHELPGSTQMQVHPKAGLTFATGLRSMLRHDPDIVMVGEIRDQETAQLAVRAALTGHLVLATLHTNDATSGITRLIDLGVEPFLLCSTLAGILSQRLVRVLCPDCKRTVEADPASLAAMGVSAAAKGKTIALGCPKGCGKCRQTGYHGRAGVFELLTIDSHLRSLIIKRSSGAQIRQSAISRGMMALAQSSWQKVQSGQTSAEEILRVLPQDNR